MTTAMVRWVDPDDYGPGSSRQRGIIAWGDKLIMAAHDDFTHGNRQHCGRLFDFAYAIYPLAKAVA